MFEFLPGKEGVPGGTRNREPGVPVTETRIEERKVYNNIMRIQRMKRDEIHTKEITARTSEKA
jgi:hypothetical protein